MFYLPHTVSASYVAGRKDWAERSARLRGKFNVDEVAGKMSDEHLRKARNLFDQIFSKTARSSSSQAPAKNSGHGGWQQVIVTRFTVFFHHMQHTCAL